MSGTRGKIPCSLHSTSAASQFAAGEDLVSWWAPLVCTVIACQGLTFGVGSDNYFCIGEVREAIASATGRDNSAVAPLTVAF